MAFLEDLEGNLSTRINRTNPDSGLHTTSANPNEDWLRKSLKTFQAAARQRIADAEVQRRKQFIDDQEGENFGNKTSNEQRGKLAASKAVLSKNPNQNPFGMLAQSNIDFNQVGQDWSDATRKATGDNYDAVIQWGMSPSGRSFLTSGGAEELDFNELLKDPTGFLIKNNNMREHRWGTDADTETELRQRGVPYSVVQAMQERVAQEPNLAKSIGIKDYGGPVHSIVKAKTGSDALAGIASGFANALTLGAEKGSAPGSTDPTSAAFWGDAVGSAADALVLGRFGVTGGKLVLKAPANAFEDWAAKKAAEKFGTNAVTRLIAKMGARGSANLLEDIPLQALQQTLYGQDATKSAYWTSLIEASGMSAGAGAAFPLAGEGIRAAKLGTGKVARNPAGSIALQAATASASTYAAARLHGEDHESALVKAGSVGALVLGYKGAKALTGSTRAGQSNIVAGTGNIPELDTGNRLNSDTAPLPNATDAAEKQLVDSLVGMKLDDVENIPPGDVRRGGLGGASTAGRKLETGVQQAFEEIDAAGERATDVLDERGMGELFEKVTGQKYKGNPRSLADIDAAVDAGMESAQWYVDGSHQAAKEFGEDAMDEYAAVFGVTAANATPEVNLKSTLMVMRITRELRASGQWTFDNLRKRLVGEKAYISGIKSVGEDLNKDGTQKNSEVRKIWNLYEHGKADVTGNAKVASYARNTKNARLMKYDPFVTFDVWMARLFGQRAGFSGKSALETLVPDPAHYRFGSAVMTRLAQERGIQPHMIQAAAWFGTKIAYEVDGTRIDAGDIAFRHALADGVARKQQVEGGINEAFSSNAGQIARFKSVANLEPPPGARNAQLDHSGEMNSKGQLVEDALPVNDEILAQRQREATLNSPYLSVSTKPGGLNRDAIPLPELIARHNEALDLMGYEPDTKQFKPLRDLGIVHEVENPLALGAWDGPEPNFRIDFPGGNYATARRAAAVLGEGLDQEAVGIFMPNSKLKTFGGLVLEHPEGGVWTPDEFARVEAEAAKYGITPQTSNSGGSIEFINFGGDATKFATNVITAVKDSGHDTTRLGHFSGDSDLLERGGYARELAGGTRDSAGAGQPSNLYSRAVNRFRGAKDFLFNEPLDADVQGNHPGLGLTETGTGTASQMSDPMTQLALRAGGSAAYGFASGDGDLNDRLTRAAEYGLAAGVTGLATSHVGGKIAGQVARTGKYITEEPLGIKDAAPGPKDAIALEQAMLKSKEEAAKLKEPATPQTIKAESKARLKKAEAKEMAAVNKRKLEAQATPEQLKDFEARSEDYMVHAESMTDDPHYFNKLMSKVPGGEQFMHAVNSIADPAANKTSYLSKKVVASAVASVDYLRTTAGTQSLRANELMNNLAPLVGKEDHLRNAARQAMALGTPIAAGYVGSEVTGDDRLKELGVLAGAAAWGATSGHQSKTRFENRPWENIQYRGLAPDRRLPEKLRSGPGKLYDILQNPERYDMTPEQSAAVVAYNKAHDDMTRETNAALQAAGAEVIPFKEGHGILQFFTEDSVKAIFGEEGAKGFRMATPGFDRVHAPQMVRDLGPTYESALRDHPGLELINDPLQLLKLEVKKHDQIRANAMLVRNLKSSGGAYVIPTDAAKQKLDTQERLDIKAHEAQLARDGWRQLPGIDDHLFHPEVIKTVDELLIPSRGMDTGPLAVADGLTNVLRQAMFTGDLSAWTMQGAMLAINDPLGTVRNAPHLIGASLFGKRYFDHWVKNNPEIWESYTKSGGVGGLEHEGLEKQGKLSLSHVPGIKQIEERGFEAFLPIHRALMHSNLKGQEKFIRNLGPHKLGKLPLGRRLASEFLKNGPLAVGIGVAATGVDIPGIDDQYEAAFAVALGLGVNVGTRKALNAEARYAGEVLSKEANVKSSVQAAKQVNRTSGAFNRQAYAITAGQAQWERTIGARSPALLRNTFILAKKATTDFGPEGAMARYYLAKTAALLGTGLAAAQFISTGQMPALNPMDDDSIFNPKSTNFMKAQGDATGSLSASNPLVGLVKAFMRTDSPDGVRKWRLEDWTPMVGLSDWYTARTPDVFGAFSQPVVNELGRGAQEKLSNAGVGAKGDSPGFARPLWQPPVPLVGKAAFQTGVVQEHTSLGKMAQPVTDEIGLKADPSFNNGRERAAALLASFGGMNHRPETLGKEATRLKTEEVMRQYPQLQDRSGVNGVKDGVVDYNDLNQAEQGGVRSALEKDTHYTDTQKKLGDASTKDDSPVQSYFNRMNGINENYKGKMQDLDTRYKAGTLSAFDAKAEYQFLAETRRKEISDAKVDLGKLAAARKGTNEDVLTYLARYMKPEDSVVNDWYSLFDEATGKDGKLDFNKLEKLQEAFKAKTPPEYRSYLDERLASFDKPKDTQFGRDYDQAKLDTKPYYGALDTVFEKVKGKGIFQGFNSYSDFEAAVGEEAKSRGMQPDQLLNALNQDPWMRRFNALVDRERNQLRRKDPKMEASLQKFYGKPPAKGTQEYKLYLRNQRQLGRSVNLFAPSYDG